MFRISGNPTFTSLILPKLTDTSMCLLVNSSIPLIPNLSRCAPGDGGNGLVIGEWGAGHVEPQKIKRLPNRTRLIAYKTSQSLMRPETLIVKSSGIEDAPPTS